VRFVDPAKPDPASDKVLDESTEVSFLVSLSLSFSSFLPFFQSLSRLDNLNSIFLITIIYYSPILLLLAAAVAVANNHSIRDRH